MNSGIDLVLKSESLAFVVGVGTEGSENLILLAGREVFSRDDSDLFFLVEQGIKFLVLLSDFSNDVKTLVLSEHSQEMDCGWVERSGFEESFIELSDLLKSNTGIFGE